MITHFWPQPYTRLGTGTLPPAVLASLGPPWSRLQLWIRNLRSGLSSASDKLWACCWDSEPQLLHPATSWGGWGNRGEYVWQLLAHKGHSTSNGALLWFFPPPGSSVLLLSLMGPIIWMVEIQGLSTTWWFLQSPPCLWVRLGSEPSVHPQHPLAPHTTDPWEEVSPLPMASGGQARNTQAERRLWAQNMVAYTFCLDWVFFSLGGGMLRAWGWNCLKSTDLDKTKPAPSSSTASQISSPTPRDKSWGRLLCLWRKMLRCQDLVSYNLWMDES